MTDSPPTRLSVIIPTTCEARRQDTLQRAIASVRDQEGICAEILVVVNGDRFDPGLLDTIKSLPYAKTVYLEVGSLPGALRHGRELVEAPFFAFLDDDDEYLPDALAQRVQVMRDEPSVDFVASNGYIHRDGQDRLYIDTPEVIHADPLRASSRGTGLPPAAVCTARRAFPPLISTPSHPTSSGPTWRSSW